VEIRNLGKSGLRVSAVGLGTNNLGQRLDASASRIVVQAAATATR
jgi:aryl-alcohol dehydrogenase-like predicted oxidoreductase